MIGQLSDKEIDDLLKQQIVGRLGCQVNDGPYIVPISYAHDGNYIYAHSSNGKKIEAMREHPKVCFEVDNINNMGHWRSALVIGRYEEIQIADERSNALRVLLNRVLPLTSSITTHLGQHWPFEPADLNSITGIVFRIRPEEKSGRFEQNEYSPSFA